MTIRLNFFFFLQSNIPLDIAILHFLCFSRFGAESSSLGTDCEQYLFFYLFFGEERGKRKEERGKRKEERGKRKEERGKRKEERGKRGKREKSRREKLKKREEEEKKNKRKKRHSVRKHSQCEKNKPRTTLNEKKMHSLLLVAEPTPSCLCHHYSTYQQVLHVLLQWTMQINFTLK